MRTNLQGLKKLEKNLSHKDPDAGHLGGSLIKRLCLAQVMISGRWDQALHWAAYLAGSRLLPLLIPLLVLSLSVSNKKIKSSKIKIREHEFKGKHAPLCL